ncbi:Myxococcus cysteine-rich repeat-containing protein [Nannocystis exedens]|uniref:Myxococcus cysteine-rich repeat-containing protein n=1 Tax=Nannocystis exedens TaxID=54 RepID=A0A1I2CA06_9BACT|nr:DUF4215 domain-containing protein [Nannocystis exedens]PCC68431.1 hypothetical protein NAEX_01445 [Nannocystis exedens]SFE65171.1 Myxococcus cysteine-rich repeat-containing protein [Nannocystis exedens]
MSIVYRSTAIVVGGLLTACPSQPVPGDTEAETDGATATAAGSETDPTTSGDPPTTGDPTEATMTTGETTTTTGETTTTGTTTGQTTGETTTEGVSATETTTSTTGEETTSTTGEETTTSTTGEDTSTSTGPDTGTSGGMPTCGDGIVQPGEVCDDGNADDDDGCLPTCELGMGVPLGPLVIPKPAQADDLRCMAPLPGWFLDASAMIVGRALANFGPEGQTASQLFEVSLPGGDDPALWDITAWAGEHGRVPLQAQGIQGHAVFAGLIDTEAQQPGSGGHLWLTGVGGDGTTEFSQEFADLPIAVTDMTWSGGDIALVGNHAAGAAGAWVLRFDGAGALMWQHEAPVGVGWNIRYRGVAMDDGGTIYAVGERHADDASADQVFLEALTPEGLVLWEVTLPSPTHAHALPTDVVVTDPTSLAVAMTQFATDAPEDSVLGYAMFAAADGAQKWWMEWAPPDGWAVHAGPVDAEPFGGMFIGVGEHDGDQSRTRVFRVDKDGAVLWATKRPGGDVRDLLFVGQPERVYALTKDAILPYESW